MHKMPTQHKIFIFVSVIRSSEDSYNVDKHISE